MNPQYGKINTYKMAASAIEEALRNAVSAGGNIGKMSVLDNFCWGNPNKPEILGSLVRSACACYDMSKAFDIPFISGKDSLHNEYSIRGQKFSIPPALLISAMGVIENAENTVTMPFKREGNTVFILGYTRNELGGSVFSKVNKIKGGIAPDVYPSESKIIMQKLYEAINKNIIEACHDCSEGGIAAAVSEMAFSAQKGVKINLDSVKCKGGAMTPAEIMFSESNGRFIAEVAAENAGKFKEIFKGSAVSEAGYVCGGEKVVFESAKHKIKAAEKSGALLNSWKNTINW
jgi:phosphoribosylformylglycinamidine synthase